MAKELLITERELIQRLALVTGHGKDVVRDVIKAQSEFVMDELKNGIPVRLGALGEICTITYKGNGGYDFDNKRMRPMKEFTRVKFKPSTTLKRIVADAD